ncbi:uncharacterized protein MONBRDRAFT_17320 [Monosiga brevicollis MX1]|uniref:Uncharacterized protein n=1 Tax=Monosiga brevicollis TaxID=81824 RepID=A9UQP7_MONBE|nr:uncharacterized protein MONBRDRAFT_17320 [Monosiga brevicollis MX1]EDQ93082.1 predicted protein [Monosiga brevicollis MX1]|eukprot:XP_001742844.1 hypothetical protein [Monosiga brevicollis MX1]
MPGLRLCAIWLRQQCALIDDTLLAEWSFEEDPQLAQAADAVLATHVQAAIMALCLNVENQNPRNGLTTEEMFPYVHYVLRHPQDWSLHTMALLTQARLEKAKVRTLQRACEQLDAVSGLYSASAAPAVARLRYLSCVNLPPHWKLLRELGRVYNSLGIYRDALEIFQRLELWEGVISCHQSLDQDEQAEALVRRRLSEEPSPDLYCVLGDLKRDVTFYDQAWELSKHRSSRAMRSKGIFLLRDAERNREKHGTLQTEKYEKAIEAFEACLKLNHMQTDVWFSLGACGLRLERWPLVCKAFRRKVEIDDDDFESWNNLANGYVKTGDKRRAYYAFHEASRHAYDNWKVWENLSAVAVDVGAFQDVLHAIERIMDIKKSYDDFEVLSALVHALVADVKDLSDSPARRLEARVRAACDRLRTIKVSRYEVWISAARFYNYAHQHAQAFEARRNAYQLVKAQAHWDRDPQQLVHVVRCLQDMLEANRENPEAKQLSSSRLLVRGAIKSVENAVGREHDRADIRALQDELEAVASETDTLLATARGQA